MEPFRRGSMRLDQPLGFDPSVHRAGDAVAELAVLETGTVVAGGVQDAELDVVLVEQLLLHEGQTAAGPSARRPGVAARGIGLALRIGWAGLIRLARARAEGLRHLYPAGLHVGEQVLVGVALRMDVAIGDRQLRGGGGLDGRTAGDLDVRATVSGRRREG
jgi:hypothetical protein